MEIHWEGLKWKLKLVVLNNGHPGIKRHSPAPQMRRQQRSWPSWTSFAALYDLPTDSDRSWPPDGSAKVVGMTLRRMSDPFEAHPAPKSRGRMAFDFPSTMDPSSCPCYCTIFAPRLACAKTGLHPDVPCSGGMNYTRWWPITPSHDYKCPK